MLTLNEYQRILSKGIEVNKNARNRCLSMELDILKKEFANAQKSKGIQKELSMISCEYYANEINRTIEYISWKVGN